MMGECRWTVPLGLTLVLVALLGATASTAEATHGSAGTEVVLCGQVVNEAGWAVENITVNAVGTGSKSFDDLPPPTTRTTEDGSFELGILADRYQIAIHDDRSVGERRWAVYLSQQRPIAAHVQAEDGACGASTGLDLGNLTLPAPANGFVEINATDAVLDGPLPDAFANASFDLGLEADPVTVAPANVDTGDPDDLRTDQEGNARLACPIGTTVQATVEKPGYRDAGPFETPCTDGLSTIEAPVFRTPVTIEGTVTDAATGDTVSGATVEASPTQLAPPTGHGYGLKASTDGKGAYELSVPWGDSYELVASAHGYSDAGPTARTVGQGDLGTPITQDFSLERITVDVSGTVEDLAGDAVSGALVNVTGPALDAPVTDTTDTDGSFSLTLPQGDHDVEIEATGKNTRTCSLTVDPDGTTTYTPDHCLTLLDDGTGALEGTVTDAVTGTGLDGVDVSTDTSETTTTASDGSYLFEATDGTRTVSFSEADFRSTDQTVEVPLDGFEDLGTTSLDRQIVQLTVDVVDAKTSASIEGAKVCVQATTSNLPSNCKTDANGNGTVIFELPWSQRADSTLDAGGWDVTGERTDAAPVYDLFTCMVDIDLEPSDTTRTCKLPAADADTITIGPILDAHTSDALAGVAVEADSDDLADSACEDPYTCENTTDETGITTLTLPDSTRRYTITASHGDYQDPTPVDDVQTGSVVLDGEGLGRVAHALTVSVRDAHTPFDVQGATVAAQGQGFTCDPGVGGFTCQAASDGDGVARLEIPWGSFDVKSLADTYDVPRSSDEVEEDVRFAEAGAPISAAAPSGSGTGPQTLGLSLLRAVEPPDGTVRGTVEHAQGGPLAGVSIVPAIEGFPFTCDPSDHNATTPPDFDCDGATSNATGAYRLDLPHATRDSYTWTLTASPSTAGTFFEEQRTGVDDGDVVDLTMWPTGFTLTVRAIDVTTGETVPFTTACIMNVDDRVRAPVPVDERRCDGNGDDAGEIAFPDTQWLREDTDDASDRFLVTAGAPDFVPGVAVEELGPRTTRVTVQMVPVLQPCFPVQYTFACQATGGPEDSDGDRWTDRQETLLGTDPDDASDPPVNGPADQDFDFVPDRVEDECSRGIVATLLEALGGELGECRDTDGDGTPDDYEPPPALQLGPII